MTSYVGIYKDLEETEIAPRTHIEDVLSRCGDTSSLDMREFYHRREIVKIDSGLVATVPGNVITPVEKPPLDSTRRKKGIVAKLRVIKPNCIIGKAEASSKKLVAKKKGRPVMTKDERIAHLQKLLKNANLHRFREKEKAAKLKEREKDRMLWVDLLGDKVALCLSYIYDLH